MGVPGHVRDLHLFCRAPGCGTEFLHVGHNEILRRGLCLHPRQYLWHGDWECLGHS